MVTITDQMFQNAKLVIFTLEVFGVVLAFVSWAQSVITTLKAFYVIIIVTYCN
jgi:hypothetical protein